MELYIGGYAQGKLAYVMGKEGMKESRIVNNLQDWFKQVLKEKPDTAEQVILTYCEEHRDAVFICDEIGNGIVPMDAFEREYRERLGRLLIELAQRADVVERVLCGLGQRLK